LVGHSWVPALDERGLLPLVTKEGSSERKRGEELGPTEKPNGRRRR